MIPEVKEQSITLPAYGSELASRLAPLFEKAKVPVYPYTQFVRPEKEPQQRTFKMYSLENRFLRVLIAPDLGGRIYSIRDKRIKAPDDDQDPGREWGAELLYANRTLKPARIEPRGSWISAGVEVNFPVAHSHTSYEAVASRSYRADGRAVVEVGETERRLGLQWVVRYSLGEDEAYLTQETFLHNPTSRPASWQIWFNAAVRANDETEFIYPNGKVLVHGTKDQLDQWPMEWSKLGACENMLGLFWLDQTDIYFGAFQHRYGYGTMHLADPKLVPGMKMWTFGSKSTPNWANLVSDGKCGYAETQSGAFKTQDDFGTMEPGQSHYLREFWAGVTSVDEIRKAVLPEPKGVLPAPEWFGMEHIPEVRRWLDLMAAHAADSIEQIPDYDPAGIDWPPTGLELEASMRWAAEHKPAYRTALGTWLVAWERYREAVEVLEGAAELDACGNRVRGLLAWRIEGDLPKARKIFDGIPLNETGFLLNFDALLSHMNDHDARGPLLERMPKEEGRVVERIAHLHVAQGRPEEALKVLSDREWPTQHEYFIRTDIWRRARAALGQPQDPVPKSLGEDPVPPVSESPTPHGPMDGVLRLLPGAGFTSTG